MAVTFNPFFLTRAEILAHAKNEGNIYFETDQDNASKIYLDISNTTRIVVGGSQLSITPNRVAVGNSSGDIVGSTNISTTELGALDGVTDNIQTQLNSKMGNSGGTFTGQVSGNALAQSNLTTFQFRNVKVGTADMEEGVTPLATGTIYIQYEE